MNWGERELASARARGQIVFVQSHHNAYSSGEHGLPMYHAMTSGQGGTPMRQYHPLFERYGVSAVISGHSEMFERSFVDTDGDGVQYYDVGVSGAGVRGERREGPGFASPLLRYNTFRQSTADQDEAEVWRTVDGVRQLVAGGKHYGHLEVEAQRLGRRADGYARITLTPVHNFPVPDANYELVRTERRTYGDVVELTLDRRGRVMAVTGPRGSVSPWQSLRAGPASAAAREGRTARSPARR